MFARFDENTAMTLQDIKETKHYGWTHTQTDARTDNVKTVYPPQTKFAGGITTTNKVCGGITTNKVCGGIIRMKSMKSNNKNLISILRHGQIQKGQGGDTGSGPPLKNHKMLYVSLEILVQGPIPEEIGPLPIAS